MTDITPQLKKMFADRLKELEPMAKHTNFRIGGPARWYAEVKSVDELKAALALCKENGVPYFVMGGGSNTLANDAGFNGLVLQMGMREQKISGTTVRAQAGAISASVARACAEEGLAGFEWAISLPGTIGGAVRGNAGCYGGEMKDVLTSAMILRDGEVIQLTNADLNFGYRESVLKHSNDIVLAAELALTPGNREELLAKQAEFLAKRKASQPLYAGSAGCIFKNFDIASDVELQRLQRETDIPGEMVQRRRLGAGWIIDNLDLKGKKIGGAMISPEHGNFVINTGNATASDVVQLIALAKTYARDRFGIQLQEEVQYLGF